jgi:O-antigen/teichoic acid export membrane protein
MSNSFVGRDVGLDSRDLDHSLVRGVAWTGAAKTFAQALSWCATIVVARLLSPDDYGIIGMATIYLGITSMITEFGLSSAVIALRGLSHNQVAQLNSLAVILGSAGVVVSLLAARPISWFFRAPDVAPVIWALSGVLLIDSCRTVPAAVLAKNMQFKYLALTEVVKSVLAAAVTLVLALAGMKYWALVVGVLLSSLAPTILVLMRHSLPWRFPKLRAVKEAVSYTRNFLITNLSWYACSNADFAVAGRILGQGPLGEYTFAWTLAQSPAEKIVGMVNRVLPSVFGAVSTDKAALRRYLLKSTEAVSLIVVPAGVGLAVVAGDLVRVVLGPKWIGAAAPLTLLALYAAFHSLSVLVPPLLLAIGKVRTVARIVLLTACILPPAFVIGGWQFGSLGIACVWVTLYPLLMTFMYRAALGAIDLSWGAYGRAVAPAATASGMMVAVLIGFQTFIPIVSPPIRLGLTILLGAVIYASCLWACFPDRMQALKESLRFLRSAPADGARSVSAA